MKNTTKMNEANTVNKSRKYATIFGIPIDSSQSHELLEEIEVYLKKKRSKNLFIVTPNPEILLDSLKNIKLADALKNADISIPDAVGTAWGVKSLTGKNIMKIKGRKFMEDLLYLANNLRLKVYFYGSTEETVKKAIKKAQSEYPFITLQGDSGPRLDKNADPVTSKDEEILLASMTKLNKFKPDIVFVALGAPKQELFISKHIKDSLNAVVMTVGGALDYFAGTKKVPPQLFNDQLEWVWRGINEKGHLKRVFRATVIFPIYVLKEKFMKT